MIYAAVLGFTPLAAMATVGLTALALRRWQR